jgi:DNA-binding NarL/FixJ family response regulator
VVLMDLALPGGAAIPATRDILSASATARVLWITAVPTARDLLTAMASGARGLVTKHDGADDLCAAIREVADGRRRFPPDLETFAAPRPGAKNGPLDVLGALSPRERQVVNLIVEGMSSRDVGRELCISLKTVETHRAHINKKLGCRSPAELVRFAARNGLLAEPTPTAEPSATAESVAA